MGDLRGLSPGLSNPAGAKLLGVITSAIVIYCMGYIVYYEFNKWGIF